MHLTQCSSKNRNHIMRKAFTIVELLIVVSISVTLLSLLLPAIQTAREAARVAACQNNLRQVALSQLDVGSMPREWQTQEGTYYGLPDRYPTKVRVGRYPTCPSTPTLAFDESAIVLPVENFGSDYAPTSYLGSGCAEPIKGWAAYIENNEGWQKITDGRSKTMMFVERAGIPDFYQENRERVQLTKPARASHWGNFHLWRPFFGIQLKPFGLHVNCSNGGNAYSFHAGVNAAMCDGSVDFKSEDIDPLVLLALFTARGDELRLPSYPHQLSQ